MGVVWYVNVVNPDVNDTVEPLPIRFIVELDFCCFLFSQVARKANRQFNRSVVGRVVQNRKHGRCCMMVLDVKIFGNNEDMYNANFLENAVRGC